MPQPVKNLSRLSEKLILAQSPNAVRREIEEGINEGKICSLRQLSEILSSILMSEDAQEKNRIVAGQVLAKVLRMKLPDEPSGSNSSGKPDLTIKIIGSDD